MFAICLGVMLGLLVAILEYVVFSYIFRQQKEFYEDKLFVKDLQIQELQDDLDVLTRHNHKTTQIAKTASKIRQFPQRDPSWNIDIPISYTCN